MTTTSTTTKIFLKLSPSPISFRVNTPTQPQHNLAYSPQFVVRPQFPYTILHVKLQNKQEMITLSKKALISVQSMLGQLYGTLRFVHIYIHAYSTMSGLIQAGRSHLRVTLLQESLFVEDKPVLSSRKRRPTKTNVMLVIIQQIQDRFNCLVRFPFQGRTHGIIYPPPRATCPHLNICPHP